MPPHLMLLRRDRGRARLLLLHASRGAGPATRALQAGDEPPRDAVLTRVVKCDPPAAPMHLCRCHRSSVASREMMAHVGGRTSAGSCLMLALQPRICAALCWGRPPGRAECGSVTLTMSERVHIYILYLFLWGDADRGSWHTPSGPLDGLQGLPAWAAATFAAPRSAHLRPHPVAIFMRLDPCNYTAGRSCSPA